MTDLKKKVYRVLTCHFQWRRRFVCELFTCVCFVVNKNA